MAKTSQKTFVTNDQGDPVECLGMTFPNDQARRAYFLEKLKEKLQHPEFRKIEGFPIGEDEDILATVRSAVFHGLPESFPQRFRQTSRPPVRHQGEVRERAARRRRESEGKNDALLQRSRIPHKGAAHGRLSDTFMHYTRPGDLVFDGFCGSGMTGVGAQQCVSPPQRPEVRDTKKRSEEEQSSKATNGVFALASSATCPRVASFIAYNYNSANRLHAIREGEASRCSSRRSIRNWAGCTRRGIPSKVQGRDQLHGLVRGLHLPRLR